MSRTPPQVLVSVQEDGTLPVPKGQDVKFYQKVREMRRDPTIRLARVLSLAPILASEWSVETEEYAPEGGANFIGDQILPMRMHIVRTAVSGMCDFGWQSYEKVFALTPDFRYVLKKLKPLLHDITDILVDPQNGDYLGLKQEPLHTDEVVLEVGETLLIAQDVEGTNWYGEATMRAVEGPYDEAQEVNKAAKRYDRKIAGSHWVIYYPYGTSLLNGVKTDNYQVVRALLAALESSGGIAIPRTIQETLDSVNAQVADLLQWKVELLSDSGNGSASFTDRFNYLDKLKVRAFGLPERAVLEGQFGTKAEAEAHADFAITNMDLRHKELVQAVNKHVVNHLLRVNYGPEYEDSVYLMPAPITDTALIYLRQLYDKILADPTAMQLELSVLDREQMRDRLNIPTLPIPDAPSYASVVQDADYYYAPPESDVYPSTDEYTEPEATA